MTQRLNYKFEGAGAGVLGTGSVTGGDVGTGIGTGCGGNPLFGIR